MNDSVSPQPVTDGSSEPLRCIIVDDEPIARRGMALLASKHPALSLEGIFSEPAEALKWLKSNTADLIFLDIEMPGIKGIDLVKHLPTHSLVVFTTAYSEYAARSYDLDAVDYLLKPFDNARFNRAVEKARLRMAARCQLKQAYSASTITLRVDRRFVNVDTDNIIYIEGVKDYVKIHTDSERLISRVTIKSLLERLPSGLFLRIHKSYIINLSRVKAFDNSNVILQSDTTKPDAVELPVGASYRTDFLESPFLNNH
ncbi:MAG: LytTR family DNA-binding domain-containing protein [Muribaculaceae bacterium]|nr:LytTR family DNA-binding domain-containing protein [Muribaculaceae bacterium]